MPRITPGPPCAVCGKASVARDLCQTHYSRWHLHGHVEQTRPADWGTREKHPLIDVWRNTAKTKVGRVAGWEDFHAFLADVGERPTDKHRLQRRDIKAMWGPDNARWKAPLLGDLKARENKATYMREWHKANPMRTKAFYLKRTHGITLADYDAMLEAQNGTCAICNGKDDHYRLAVDHCHTSGEIRGLLCADCNRALGMMKDDPERLERAAAYLRKPRHLKVVA